MSFYRVAVAMVYIFSVVIYSGVTHADDYSGNLDSTQYDIYYGDADGDGEPDVYFHPKDRIVLLHGDIITPIVLPKAKGVLVSNSEYFIDLAIVELELTESEIGSLGLTLAVNNTDYFFGDFDGDGIDDIIVRGSTEDAIALQLSGSDTTDLPSLAAVYGGGGNNTISNRSNTFTVMDANHDGADDLVILSGGKAIRGYLSGGSQLEYSEGDAFKLSTAKLGVGATAGQHEVSPDGSASYQIPVIASPGIGGIAPAVSISYNSGAGNGLLGIGWGLGASSSIQRCASTLVNGGLNDAVDFDGNDRFCLDGVPLVAVSGTYGENATEYRTQSESFSKIVSYGSVGSCTRNGVNVPGPQKFKVWLSTGEIMEYGYTADSRVEALGCSDVLEWSLNKESDRFGNAMNLSYTESNGEHYLSRIDYNGGESYIEFSYIDREDKGFAYFAGTKQLHNKLLAKISSFEGDRLLREYHLQYEVAGADAVSRLKKVIECTDSYCLPATEFEWTSEALSQSVNYDTRIYSSICANGSTAHGTCNDADNNYTLQYPDINGDAFSDICFRADSGINCILGTESGFTGTSISTSICANDSGLYGQCNDIDNYDTIQYLDVDADGADDLVFRSDSGVRVMKFNGSGFSTYINSTICANNSTANGQCNDEDNHYSIRFADVNGDGLADVCYRGDLGLRCLLGTGTDFGGGVFSTTVCSNYSSTCNDADNRDTINFIDIDGDGMSDLVVRTDTGVRAWRSTGTGFVAHITSTICANGSFGGSCNDEDNFYSIKYPDINGDGIADLCYRGDSGISCLIGTGYSWEGGLIDTSLCSNNSGICNDGDNYRTIDFQDINQDGRDDLIFRSDYGLYAYRSVGEAFEYLFFRSDICANNSYANGICNDADNHYTIKFNDFNGDGLPDLVYRGDSGVQLWPMNIDRQNLLSSVKSGLGAEVRFEYRLMTDSSIYTASEATPAYPVTNVVGPSYLLTEVSTSDGLGNFNAQSYVYKGLKAHLAGYGSLGFEEITQQNTDTGISTKTTYSQDYANHRQGRALSLVTTAPSGVVLARTDNVWKTVTLGSGDAERYLVMTKKTTTVKKDLDNSFLSKNVAIYPAYNAYGQATQSLHRLYDASDNLLRTTTVDNTFNNDTVDWFIGQPTRTTTSVQVTGKPLLKRVATWEYDGDTGRLSKEQIRHPDTDAILHETRYGIDGNGNSVVDSFGNNLAVTVAGPDFSSRTTLAEFDSSGRFVMNKSNELGHSGQMSYYSGYETGEGTYPGKQKLSTDANGVSSYFVYDEFGRPETVYSAWGSSSQTSVTSSYKYCDSSCPDGAVYYIVTQADGAGESREYFDSLARTLRKGSESMEELGGAKTFVYVDYEYNHRGQLSRVSLPYFSGDGSSDWTYTDYDLLDRPTDVTLPDGRQDKIIYNGLTKTRYADVNGKNQKAVAVSDEMGNLIEATDNENNSIFYDHDSLGRATITTDIAGEISIDYDALGRKVSMVDPNKGAWSYTYNGLGQLISQTNARGETTCNAYDKLGRLIKRIDNYQGAVSASVGQASQSTNQCAGDASNAETATWIYDTATGNAKGKIHKVLGKDGYQEEMVYDTLGRAIKTITTIDGTNYTTETSYDTYSRPVTVTYPGASSRLNITNVYNTLGLLAEVRNTASNDLYYQVQQWDESGRVVQEMYGNGVQTLRNYEYTTGRIQSIGSLSAGSAVNNVQNLGFQFDDIGNLSHREDSLQGFSEDFYYDELNRLKTNQADFGNGDIRTTGVSYDDVGNIVTKTGVGNYKYGSQCTTGFGPHAVCEISGSKNAAYTYDANGNMLTGDGRSNLYTYFDKPYSMTRGNATTEINYGPGRSRYFRRDTVAGKITEYTYVGAYEKVEFKDDGINVDKVEERHTIGGFAIVTIENRGESGENIRTRYLHRDHLGSVTTITDEIGNIAEQFSFDPWGKRRAPSLIELEAILGSWAGLSTNQKHNLTIGATELASAVTNQGFTGHEQMDAIGLIHMNGRVYDAELGRMLQADPMIPDATDLQAYNRYAYVRNNPLSLTDPSGFSWISDQWHRADKLGVKIYKTIRKYDLTQQLAKKTNNELVRFQFQKVHPFVRKHDGGVAVRLDNYLRDHPWAQVVGAAIATYFGGGFGAVASAAHLAYLQGANVNQIRRAAVSAYVSSYASSIISGYINGAPISNSIKMAAHTVSGYVVQGVSNEGHFGSFKNYLRGWGAGVAANWVIGVAVVLAHNRGGEGLINFLGAVDDAQKGNDRVEQFIEKARGELSNRMQSQASSDKYSGESLGIYVFYDESSDEYRLSRVFVVDLERGYFINPEACAACGGYYSYEPPHPRNAWYIPNGYRELVVGKVVRQFNNTTYDFSSLSETRYQHWADLIKGPVVVDVRSNHKNGSIGPYRFSP